MLKANYKAMLKSIPSVDKILNWQEIKELENKIEHKHLLSIIRSKTDEFREKLLSGSKFEIDYLKKSILDEIKYLTEPYFRYAINGLGIVLHTGLGRAPFSKGIADTLRDASNAYSRLQIDDEGKRDDRYKKISKLLQILTGCEAGIIVNNNAGATLLILSALAKGKEVIVSRGQLIEIGGSFRIPDIMAESGCIMREVGTTNRTHLKDYEQAIRLNAEHAETAEKRKGKKKLIKAKEQEQNIVTGAIIRVHQSNYHISGFTKEVSLSELVNLGKKYNIPVIDDLGSGALIDLSKYGLPKEPMVQESLATGADVVCFSGDKLIGGPQAGIVVGKKALVEKIKKNPLTRALRCDKLTNAALEATLQMFLHKEEDLIKEHRVMSMLLKPLNEIKSQANGLAKKLDKEFGSILDITVKPAKSEIGGGSLSTEELETFVVAIKPKTTTETTRFHEINTRKGKEKSGENLCQSVAKNVFSVQQLAKLLRQYKTPIFGRVAENSLLLDFRTILKGEEKIIFQAINNILATNKHE
jgi:L-seryl-tRNA(Ser) seleniumtransferase